MSATAVETMIANARRAYQVMRDGEDLPSESFDVLVHAFDAAVRAMASAPCASLADARAKARFLQWIGEDEQGNQLADTSFLSRFLAELAGRDFTDADEAQFWEAAE